MVLGELVDGRVVEYHCLVHTRPDLVSLYYRYGGDPYEADKLMRHLCWALVKEVLAADGLHNELGEATSPHDRRTKIALLPQQTCTHEALKKMALVVAVAVVIVAADGDDVALAGIQEKALGVGRLSVTSDRGCCCDRDSERYQGVLEIHPRWVAGDCLSVVRAHGGCAMFVTSWMGHCRVAVMGVDCFVGR